ncbi:hypothetical protein Y1Q_0010960 [Alligator mississippiensis]|uniref:Uncharacterized protein n=1 Tax=Alligator mississippiensis TaxID=8496 RepID=A0A151MEI4_ALLMI|nr:hypothetical protein Y1Q_0010960 [Alligator mississippiensis]
MAKGLHIMTMMAEKKLHPSLEEQLLIKRPPEPSLQLAKFGPSTQQGRAAFLLLSLALFWCFEAALSQESPDATEDISTGLERCRSDIEASIDRALDRLIGKSLQAK